MECWICSTCGVQYGPSEQPTGICALCQDERQYIGHAGQKWTTMDALKKEGFSTIVKQHEPGVRGIGIKPSFTIGQRAILVQTEAGNILWDCISLFDEQAIAAIQDLGGLKAMAISHPHYYTSMVEWANYFNIPIYLHEADRQWVMRPSQHIQFWSGNTLALPGFADITLICLGGHFPGSTVLHWANTEILLTGDTISVVADRRWVSFMYSYTNFIPLSADEVLRIRNTIAPYRFSRLYGAWFSSVLEGDAHEAVLRSADRYLKKVADHTRRQKE